MRQGIPISILSLLALFAAPTGFAQTPVERTVNIDSVVVSARPLDADIVPAQVLAGEELKRLNSHSVADALRYFSGMQVKDYGGIGGLKTVNIRSMGSQHVGVFYDGIQISNAQNGTVDLGKFSLDNMETLSVYNGQKSDIFQSARDFASAGALYMVTRKPQFANGKRDNFNVKVKAGSFHLADVSALWEHRLSDGLSMSLNAEGMYSSGKYKFRDRKLDGYDTTMVRRNGRVWYARAEAALFGKFARQKGEWQAKGYFYASRRGYPGAVVKEDFRISLLNEDHQRDRNWFVQGRVRQEVAPFYSYRLQLKYANDYTNYIMPLETTGKPANDHYMQQEIYFTAANLFTVTRWWTVNISTDVQHNRLDADGDELFDANFPVPRRLSVLAAAASSVNLERFSAQASVLYTHVHDVSARGYAAMPDKNVFTPTAIASYKPIRGVDLNLRAFYKKIFRMPTFNDLYYVRLGNRLLRPEYTTQYNVGLAYDREFERGFLAALHCSIDGYFNQVKDKIIATPTSNQLIWTMVNLDYVEILGVDVAVNPRFRAGSAGIGVRLAYTYQKASDLTPGKKDTIDPNVRNPFGDQIPYVPRHSGSAIVNASWRGWEFNYSFIYTGTRYVLGGNIPANRLQPWYTHDMSLAKNFVLKKVQLRAAAEINNIFNQQYAVVLNYPMPGTNFKITLSVTL